MQLSSYVMDFDKIVHKNLPTFKNYPYFWIQKGAGDVNHKDDKAKSNNNGI